MRRPLLMGEKNNGKGCVFKPLYREEQSSSDRFMFARFGLPPQVHSKAVWHSQITSTGWICQVVLESRPCRCCFVLACGDLFFFFFRKILQGCSNSDVNTVCVISERWCTTAITGLFRADARSACGLRQAMMTELIKPSQFSKGFPWRHRHTTHVFRLTQLVETTYLLWQLVARSPRASRCLWSNPAAAECLLFPFSPR